MPSSAAGGNSAGAKGAAASTRSRRALLHTRLCQLTSLRRAFERIAKKQGSRGVDEITVAAFAANRETELRGIRERLRAGTYVFQPLRPVAIEKKDRTGYRPILVPTVADRVVQRAILNLVFPHLREHTSSPNSHAFREGVGVRSAVYQLREQLSAGKRVVLAVDIANFFPSIDPARLYADVAAHLPDESLLPLLKRLQGWEIGDLGALPERKKACFPDAGKGIPQGSALSPLLSNFYLRDVDREAQAAGFVAIRYADDIAVPCATVEQAQSAFRWLRSRLDLLGLKLHDLPSKKSRIVEIDGNRHKGVEYLGFFLIPRSTGVKIKPAERQFANAQQQVAEFFSPAERLPLAQRYDRLGYFLNSWLSTYGYVCENVDAERAHLLDCAQRSLTNLLVSKGLLRAGVPLSSELREFLGVDAVFRRAGGTAKVRQAVRAAARSGNGLGPGVHAVKSASA